MREWLLRPIVRYSLGVLALIALAAAAFWMMPRSPEPTPPSAIAVPDDSQSPVPLATRERIDRWITETRSNRYGDPATTNYRGGTPLFDPRTGKYKDRYLYILERHPELNAGKPEK